jgi:hypothetical protein
MQSKASNKVVVVKEEKHKGLIQPPHPIGIFYASGRYLLNTYDFIVYGKKLWLLLPPHA